MPILNDKNTHRHAPASRLAFLIDGEAYFCAARSSILQARHTVYLLAWDINSHMRMIRGDVKDGAPECVGDFLLYALERNPELNIYILLWDYSLIYLAEREWSPLSVFQKNKHPRLHFHRDNHLPATASHHQKVLVVDDWVGYAGGLDLSVWRWDSTERKANDERRIDNHGKPYAPYHDCQLLVEGAAASQLGDLFRERWERATGEALKSSENEDASAWPQGIEADMQEVEVHQAFTQAKYKQIEQLRQVEQMTLDCIHAARHSLYLENQYFSSHAIASALAESLQAPEGPEVTFILTADTNGWLQEGTMGLLRDRLLEILHDADKHDRLRVFTPWVNTSEDKTQVYVHAKVHIVDDRLIKIGSSNLSNRSMRVDTECDLIVEQPDADPAIQMLKYRLVALYFQVEPNVVAEGVKQKGSLNQWLDSQISDEGHSLHPFVYGCNSDWERALADKQLLDPDEPISPLHWVQTRLPEPVRPRVLKKIMWLALVTLLSLLLFGGLSWFWSDSLSGETVADYLRSFEQSAWSWLLLLSVFLIGGCVGMPLNVLLIAATMVFNPWLTLICGYSGAFMSAVIIFFSGRMAGRPLVERFAKQRAAGINEMLKKRGILPVVLLRLLPVAPFPIINALAGSTKLSFRDYSVGTLLGMFPGMCAVVFLAEHTMSTLAEPSYTKVGLLGGAIALLIGVMYGARRLYRSIALSAKQKGSVN